MRTLLALASLTLRLLLPSAAATTPQPQRASTRSMGHDMSASAGDMAKLIPAVRRDLSFAQACAPTSACAGGCLTKGLDGRADEFCAVSACVHPAVRCDGGMNPPPNPAGQLANCQMCLSTPAPPSALPATPAINDSPTAPRILLRARA